MQRQRVFAFVLVIAGAAGPARAQSSEGLAGLLLRFFSPSNPVVLAPNTANPALSHDAHFISQANAQATLRQLNAGIAAQLSTFPIGSSSGGFTFTFDESLGVYNRTTQSFGPIFAERPLTAGKGKFSLAVNYQHGTWDRIDGLDLGGGELPLYLVHEDTNRDNTSLNLFFEGDIIESQLAVDLKTDTTVFLANYGISERLDIGLALPFQRVDLDASITATVDNVATVTAPAPIHLFDNGTPTNVYRESGSASGIGDMLVRAKWNLYRGASASAALGTDLRLPTGDEAELLGSGATQVKLYGVVGGSPGRFSPRAGFGLHVLERRQRVHRRPAGRAQLHGSASTSPSTRASRSPPTSWAARCSTRTSSWSGRRPTSSPSASTPPCARCSGPRSAPSRRTSACISARSASRSTRPAACCSWATC